jgi:hypothetical protein
MAILRQHGVVKRHAKPELWAALGALSFSPVSNPPEHSLECDLFQLRLLGPTRPELGHFYWYVDDINQRKEHRRNSDP